MSIILELREHLSHAGTPLVHPTSEDVVLANVFGVIRNLSPHAVLLPWMERITGLHPAGDRVTVSFWEKQPRPIGIQEGNTVVDLVLEWPDTLVFLEVKMGAPASRGTTHDPDRNQLLRNLDVGFCRAEHDGKAFAVVFVTPDTVEPSMLTALKAARKPFPVNRAVTPHTILACLHWAPWSSLGDAVAWAYESGQLNETERRLALDLLAYLAHKRLWQNSLTDDKGLYSDKLYRSLRRNSSPFVPYAEKRPERYEGWRNKPWDECPLREFLQTRLSMRDRALLKVFADAGGSIRQDRLIEKLPSLVGKTSRTLQRFKSQLNAACKQQDRAALLAEGVGSGNARVHEIDRRLGPLRSVVIEVARGFDIDWDLLTPTRPPVVVVGGVQVHKDEGFIDPPLRRYRPSANKAWYILDRGGSVKIAALANAKGSCSLRRYSTHGHFLGRQYAKGNFDVAFESVIAGSTRFDPPYQPDLMSTEKAGLPKDILECAMRAARS